MCVVGSTGRQYLDVAAIWIHCADVYVDRGRRSTSKEDLGATGREVRKIVPFGRQRRHLSTREVEQS